MNDKNTVEKLFINPNIDKWKDIATPSTFEDFFGDKKEIDWLNENFVWQSTSTEEELINNELKYIVILTPNSFYREESYYTAPTNPKSQYVLAVALYKTGWSALLRKKIS